MRRGELRVYLGSAPGVGKTYAMLAEGKRRRARGADVVVAFADPRGRSRTQEQLIGLEIVPSRRPLQLDIAAVLTRAPEVALVDDLAARNPEGAANSHRWQDVEQLLRAGIDVVATLNIESLESLANAVTHITGVAPTDSIPDEVVRAADQVELVDMTAEALRRRLAHGNVVAPDQLDAATAEYFRPGNLNALRELALLWVADRVDDALRRYMDDHEIEGPWPTRERVVVAVTGAPSSRRVIRRAASIAHRFHGELIGVHVVAAADRRRDDSLLDQHRQLLVDLGGTYQTIASDDVAGALVSFARDESATQLVLGAARQHGLQARFKPSIVNDVFRRSPGLELHVIDDPGGLTSSPPGHLALEARSPLPVRRRRLGWMVAVGGTVGLTAALLPIRDHMALASVTLLYLVVVALAATLGGRSPSVFAAVLASGSVNFFFTPPVHTLVVSSPENVLALVIFLGVAILVGGLVSKLAEREAEARRSRTEAESLIEVMRGLVGDDPLNAVTGQVRSTFGLDSVSVITRGAEGSWRIEAFSGPGAPTRPEDGEAIVLSNEAMLVLKGPTLEASARRVLLAFAAQLATTLEQASLRRDAQVAETQAEADRLRTALLRAVSHDLRTPLSSIKASVTSLKQSSVDWSEVARAEFLDTIDEETDRLNRVIADLLDMSRLEADAVAVRLQPTYLDEVVSQALTAFSRSGPTIDIDVSEMLPAVVADPALLERAVENLVSNAIAHSPPESPIRIQGAASGDRVVLRVVDHGPGIARDARDRVFEPFQREGDSTSRLGVGLGLAVARGFVEAIGGSITLEDTPAGGLTALIDLVATNVGDVAGSQAS